MTANPWPGLDVRGRRLERAPFHLQIGLDVNLQRFQVRVPEEVLDGDWGDAGLQQVHGLGMAKRVGTDAGPLERGYFHGGESAIVREEKADPRAGELVATTVRE